LILGCSVDTKRRLLVQDPGKFRGFHVPKAFHFRRLLEQLNQELADQQLYTVDWTLLSEMQSHLGLDISMYLWFSF